MRQGDEIVYIERAYSERSGMQVVRAIGGRAPLHLTSVGKLFLAHDDAQRVRAYATRTGLAGHTRQRHHRSGRARARPRPRDQYGTARDNEELELGVRCMAAGILDDQNEAGHGVCRSRRRPIDSRRLARTLALQPRRRSRRRSAATPEPRPHERPASTAGVSLCAPIAHGTRNGTSGNRRCFGDPAPGSARRRRFAKSCRPSRGNTMIRLTPAVLACITRQRPASLM